MSGMSGPPPPTHCPDHVEALAYLPSLLHSPLWPRNALYLWTCTQDSSQCRCCFWLDKGSCKYTWAEVTQDLLWPNPQHVCLCASWHSQYYAEIRWLWDHYLNIWANWLIYFFPADPKLDVIYYPFVPWLGKGWVHTSFLLEALTVTAYSNVCRYQGPTGSIKLLVKGNIPSGHAL